MTRKVIFENNALEEFSNWGLYDSNIFRKIMDLIRDILRNPFNGIGKPEPLKHELKNHWSRRIIEKHRLVYKINNENDVIIVSCKGHYC